MDRNKALSPFSQAGRRKRSVKCMASLRKSARLDDGGVALPVTGGISELYRKLKSGGKFASIRENLAVKVFRLRTESSSL